MSRSRSVVVAVAVGAIIGAGAFFGWRAAAGDEAASEPTAISSPPTSVIEVEAPWIADGIRYETTVVVPLAFTVTDGIAELEYVAETISPALDRHGEQVAGTPIDVLVLPERWLLEIDGSAPVEATTDAEDGSVRFAVPATTGRDDVVALQVVGWRRAMLVGDEAVLPLQRDAEVTMHDGTTLVVQTVLQQATSTIVQVEVDEPDDLWHPAGPFGFRAGDARWRLSGGFGGGGFQMTWEGDDAPDAITIVQTEPEWLPVDAAVTIIGGASP